MPAARRELKYEIPAHEAPVLARRLGMLFPRDGHAGRDGRYTVRSLYFDTPFDDALREKHEGFTARTKWRLRAYGSAPIPPGGSERSVRLEKKVKRDGLVTKHTAWVTPAEARFLAGMRAEPASAPGEAPCRGARTGAGGEDPVLAEFRRAGLGCGLVPCVVVAYEREAFTFAPGNVRITIDAHLRSSPHPASFFEPGRLLSPYAPGTVIVEVKYDAFIPDIVRDAVRMPGAVRVAHSKYALARRWE